MENHTKLSRQLVIEWTHRWGSSVVESILDPQCQIFSVPYMEGLIGYHANYGCAVVFGDPICAPHNREALVKSFHKFCEDNKKNVVYLVASNEFSKWMQKELSCALITFGNELFLNPHSDPRLRTGKNGISLRGKVRQAEKSGVFIKEYREENPDLELKLKRVASQWLKDRHGPQIYISRVRLFGERYGKRWFYAVKDDEVIGAVVLNNVQIRGGWILDRIMTVPHAPQGTSELLVIKIMEALARDGCSYLTFGATNGTNLGTMYGFSRPSAYLAKKFYSLALKFFKLQYRGKYWEKFFPQSEPSFLVFKNPHLGFFEIKGIMQALNVSLKF